MKRRMKQQAVVQGASSVWHGDVGERGVFFPIPFCMNDYAIQREGLCGRERCVCLHFSIASTQVKM